jgi:Na+-transporting methylmalonyl-CoA/oxaloacetate decarboxylase gamma subunit
LESDNHLTFLFIFLLFVIACLVGESNNQALQQRKSKKKHQQRVECNKDNHAEKSVDYSAN